MMMFRVIAFSAVLALAAMAPRPCIAEPYQEATIYLCNAAGAPVTASYTVSRAGGGTDTYKEGLRSKGCLSVTIPNYRDAIEFSGTVDAGGTALAYRTVRVDVSFGSVVYVDYLAPHGSCPQGDKHICLATV
jgi:hypothetical protein